MLASLCIAEADAQIKCFVQTSFDTRAVYAQQPFKITFTVVTATWFTAPLQFDNIQIPNAFVIPFDRTFSSRFTVNGKEYPGLQFYFIVFPYKPGNYTIPPIKIVATTPPEGESVSKKTNLYTRPEKFVVKAIPENFDGSHWFVAKNASISQRWNKALTHLKVGDVIERTITVNARGTLPQFIPETKTDSLDWAAIYPDEPVLRDTRNDYDANGIRTQTFTYLLEKEGDFQLPACTVEWWNPYSRRVFKRSTENIQIRVAANPDLGILTTLKDSLHAAHQNIQPAAAEKTGPYRIAGIPWYWFLLYTMGALILLYILFRTGYALYKKIAAAYKKYRNSEYYWFKKFRHSGLQYPEFLNRLYAWWDRREVAKGGSDSIIAEAKKNGMEKIKDELSALYEPVYHKNQKDALANREFKEDMERYRKQMKGSDAGHADPEQDIHQKPW